MAQSGRTDTPSGESNAAHSYPVIKPKPAGTLLILDEQNGRPHVLMGRRHKAHTFMPDVFVFPGGRVDRPDNHAPFHSDLTKPTLERLMASGLKSLATHRRARAFALAAIRETFEEVGMLIGNPVTEDTKGTNSVWAPFLNHKQVPNLAPLRYVARAVTPPGLVRRYDTRFFTATRSAISLELKDIPTDELNELSWIPLDQTDGYEMPRITQMVLNDVSERITAEGTIALHDDHAVPVYTARNGKHRRDMA
ncbi:NUDIX domain-containing protein [Pararhizobium sp. IMCC21322]|uniref:NUDIX domain-containing protein n=1 Tax=Pararhizobium sp. IMCC21322 TaxID=3067903 RepID=UPI002740FBFE|nr:NUDIX domain-containing protein [Pararhizobium sp. IMCC21322]